MGVEQIEQSEQILPQAQKDIQITTLNDFLNKEIQDPAVREKFDPIIAEVTKEIPENDIVDCFQNNEFSTFVMTAQMFEPKESKDFFIGEIMNYLQSVGKSISTINEQITEEIQEKKETKTIEQSRSKAREDYDKLAPELKPNADQLSNRRQVLEDLGVLGQIADPNQVDDFVALSYTNHFHGDKPEATEFKASFSTYKETAGIVENFDDLNRTKSAEVVLDVNENLKGYADGPENQTYKPLKKFDYFDQLDDSSALLKFATDEQRKSLIDTGAFDDDLNLKKKVDPQSQEAKDAIVKKQELVDQISSGLNNKTQSAMRQRSLTATIQGLASYFSKTQIDGKNFSDQYMTNPGKDFSINDNVLHMGGEIQGQPLGFRYNLEDPDAQLQCDASMFYDPIEKTFTANPGEPAGAYDMGIKMPTLSFLSDKSQSFASSRMASYLENSDSLEDFDAHFKADLSDYLSGFYGKEAVVKNRVKHNVEKNLLYQDFSDHYIPGGENKKISPTETPEANKLMTLMYNTIDNNDSEYSNTQDIQRFHTILDKLAKLAIDDEQTQRPNLETSRKEFLSGLRDDSGEEEIGSERGTDSLAFFKLFVGNKNADIAHQRLHIDDMEVFVETLEKKESLEDNLDGFSADFQTQFEQSNLTKEEKELEEAYKETESPTTNLA